MGAGLALSLVALIVAYAILLAVSWIIVIIRVAIHDEMSGFQKVLWILGCLILPIVSMFYFIFVERNGFLKFCGWLMMLCTIVAIVFLIRSGVSLDDVILEARKQRGRVSSTMLLPSGQMQAAIDSAPKIAPVKFKWNVNPDEDAAVANGGVILLSLVNEKNFFERKKLYEKGMAIYGEVLTANPRNAEALVGRGVLQNAYKADSGHADLQAANALITQAVTLYPAYGDLYALRSRALRGLRKNKGARDDLQKAISTDPENISYQNALKIFDMDVKIDNNP